MTAPMTFAQLGEGWPEALVLWDRDIAGQAWTPVFSREPVVRLPHLELLAFDASCTHATGGSWDEVAWETCRCVAWTGTAWITLRDARYEAVRSALRGQRFPCDSAGAKLLWYMLGAGCAAEITPRSLLVPYIISGRSDHYELSLAPGILSFLLGGSALPETGHLIRRIHHAAPPFDGSFPRVPAWDVASQGARYVRIDDVEGRTVFRIRSSEAALVPLGPEIPVIDPIEYVVLARACPHCGRIPERYRVLRDGSHICLACGRSVPA